MPARLYPDLEAFYTSRSPDNESWAAGPASKGSTVWPGQTHLNVNTPVSAGQAVVPASHHVGIHRIQPSAPPVDFHSPTTMRQFHRNIFSTESDYQTASDNNETEQQRSPTRQRRATVTTGIQLNDLNGSKVDMRSRDPNYRAFRQVPGSIDVLPYQAKRGEVASDVGRRREVGSVATAKTLNIPPRPVESLLQQRHQRAMHDKLCCIRSKPLSSTEQSPVNQRAFNQGIDQRPILKKSINQGAINRRTSNQLFTHQRFVAQNFKNQQLTARAGEGIPRPYPRNVNSRKPSTAPRFVPDLQSENTAVKQFNEGVANRRGQYLKTFDFTQKPSEEEFQEWVSWRRAVNGHFAKSILTQPDPAELSRDREHVTKQQPHPGTMVRVFQEAAGGRTTRLEQRTYILFGIPRVTRLHLMDLANHTQPSLKRLRI